MDRYLQKALLEAGFRVKTVETKGGKKVVTVEDAESPEPSGEPCVCFDGGYSRKGKKAV
ncbi:MAG: hypothetical protein LBI86_05370 [Treponema sp.]|nr:hypothetical protein [Treponema sp.]